jgi:DNA-binding GntR family transcriptional regulator
MFTTSTSTNDIYEIIQEMIFSGKLKPGETVTEIGLSKILGFSRTPVREALRHLEQEGLIISENRRKRINILSIKDIEDIFDLKICIECSVAKWAAENRKVKDSKALNKLADQMIQVSRKRPHCETEEEQWFQKYLEVDNKIHHLIFQMGNNAKAEQTIYSLNKQWHRFKVGLLAIEGRIEKAAEEHFNFVQAIVTGDSEKAYILMETHLENLKRMIIKLLKHFHYPSL